MRARNIGDVAVNAQVNQDVPWYRQILNALPGLATTYISIDQQRQLAKINVTRAMNGQPAIAADEYAAAGVNVGVNKSTQNTIIIVAAGLGLALVLAASANSGGRRRR